MGINLAKKEKASLRNEKVKIDAIKYNNEIIKRVNDTIIIDGFKELPEPPNYNTKIIVENIDVINSMFLHQDEGNNKAVLNHASYKAPAQQYLLGSDGREESLCDNSFLYNVLSSSIVEKDYYNFNKKKCGNRGMFVNRALYTPDVIFENNNKECFYSVISTTAPNRQLSIQYKMFTDDENKVALKERLDFILNIAAINKIDVLILGAFGCSVYKQNPQEVAAIWKELLKIKYRGYFKTVYIPITNNKQFEIFNDIFTN